MQFEVNGPTTVYHIQELTIKCFVILLQCLHLWVCGKRWKPQNSLNEDWIAEHPRRHVDTCNPRSIYTTRLSAEARGHSPADLKQNLFYFSPVHANGPDIYITVC